MSKKIDFSKITLYSLLMISESMQDLIAEIDAFLKTHDMKPQTLGTLAFNNEHLVRRLKEGMSPSMTRGDAIRAWMRNYKPPKKRKKKTESNLQQSAA